MQNKTSLNKEEKELKEQIKVMKLRAEFAKYAFEEAYYFVQYNKIKTENPDLFANVFSNKITTEPQNHDKQPSSQEYEAQTNPNDTIKYGPVVNSTQIINEAQKENIRESSNNPPTETFSTNA